MSEALKLALLELKAAMFKVSGEADKIRGTEAEKVLIDKFPFKCDLTEMSHHVADWVDNLL